MQSKADFLCPIWAPIRFVLKVSEDHTRATEQILLLLETLDRAIIHVNIYEELEPDGEISAALLGLWSDIVDYCIRASQHYGRRTVKRLVSLIGKPYKSKFSKMRENIRDRMTDLHRLVMAKEALRESQAREGCLPLHCITRYHTNSGDRRAQDSPSRAEKSVHKAAAAP